MQFVDIKIHGNIATLLIDRAPQRNALNPQLIEDLQTAFSDVHQEKRVEAIVLSGAGEDFCSGLDLEVMRAISAKPFEEATGQWFAAWQDFTELIEQVLRFPKPIVAAVDGAAVGGGLALCLAADLLVVSHQATFSAAAIRRGLVGGATTALLNFRFGASIAARMSLTGDAISADQAHRWGWCDAPVDSNQIWVAASELARRCTGVPREAMQATKRLLNESIGELLITQISAAAAASAAACTTESASEGISAFCEKRDPNWP